MHWQSAAAWVLLEAVWLLVLRFPGDDVDVVLLSPNVALTRPHIASFTLDIEADRREVVSSTTDA